MNNLHVLYLNCTSQAYWTSLLSSTARIPMQIYIIYVLEGIHICIYTWNRIQNANFLTSPSEQYNTPSFQTRRVDDKTITKQSRSPERSAHPSPIHREHYSFGWKFFTIFFCAILLSFPNWSKSAISISISLRIQDFAGCVEECRNMARHVRTEIMCVCVWFCDVVCRWLLHFFSWSLYFIFFSPLHFHSSVFHIYLFGSVRMFLFYFLFFWKVNDSFQIYIRGNNNAQVVLRFWFVAFGVSLENARLARNRQRNKQR